MAILDTTDQTTERALAVYHAERQRLALSQRGGPAVVPAHHPAQERSLMASNPTPTPAQEAAREELRKYDLQQKIGARGCRMLKAMNLAGFGVTEEQFLAARERVKMPPVKE